MTGHIRVEVVEEIIELLWDLEGAVECEPSGHERLRKRVVDMEKKLREANRK